MSRVVVIGDVGGHRAALVRALTEHAGMDPATYTLPAGVTVVQVGDLVHRGPNSDGVIGLVAAMRRRQPTQWVQLVGNHEALYLPDEHAPGFHWPEVISDEAADTVRQWWADGWMRAAAAIQSPDGDLLVTHAGVTAPFWERAGEPGTVAQAAAVLNAMPTAEPHEFWRAGLMLGADRPRWTSGPVWAEAGWEVYQSWLVHAARGQDVPFGQVHGHSTSFDFNRGQWRRVPGAVRAAFAVDMPRRHVRGRIGGQTFHGIDPQHGTGSAKVWSPLVLDGARVLDVEGSAAA